MTIKELRDNPELWEQLKSKAEKCACGGVLSRDRILSKICDDCYYQLLGEEIEKHPIGRGIRRV